MLLHHYSESTNPHFKPNLLQLVRDSGAIEAALKILNQTDTKPNIQKEILKNPFYSLWYHQGNLK